MELELMARKRADNSTEDQKIIEQAEKDWERCQADCKEIQAEYTADKKFVFEGKQYPDDTDASADPGNPKLTVNKLTQFVLQVANDARQNNPMGKIMPAKDGATESLAKVRTGLYRAIDRNSNGKAARQHALLDAIGASYGFYRVLTEYEDADSFDQVIKLQRIMDAATVTWDADCEQPDYSDASCYFIQSSMSKQKFKAVYGKDAADYLGGKISTVWGTADHPTITEYWYVEMIPDTLYKLVDDTNKFRSELDKLGIGDEAIARDESGEMISRPSKRRQVWQCKIAGGKMVEPKTKWPGYWIPIIPVLGRETIVDGKRKLTSLSRPAKDSQRMYNYARSNQARRMSKATKGGWIIAEESISPKFMPHWMTSNTKDWGALPYKAYSSDGKPLPAPFMAPPQSMDQGLIEEAQMSTQEMKETQGIYESGLGAKGNEVSGRAILAREKQGDTATYDFNDNLNIAIRFEVMIINDLIPYVYDVPRQIRILGEDMAEEIIMVNAPGKDGLGNEYHHDMSIGKYSVTVSTGPAYATQRQETAEAMMEWQKSLPPELSILTADIAARALDFQGADVAAERFKKFLDKQFPGIVEPSKPKEGEPKPPDPELLAFEQHAQQIIQQKNMEVQQGQMQLQEVGQKAAQTEQENQQLKVANANKQGEQALKEKELLLKEQELNLKHVETEHKIQMDLAAHQLTISQAAQARQDKLDEAAAETEQDAMEIQQTIDGVTAVIAPALDSIAQTNQQVLEGITQLGAILQSPKVVQVHRDASGKITHGTAQHQMEIAE
jgi:hypothetical protein